MNQFFIAIILILGLGSWYLYNENQTLTANNIKLESAVEEQKQTMAALQESYERQGKALGNLQRRNNEIEADKARYLEIFSKHNLDKLALVKPGMIETRFNNGTAEVFKEIENDTKQFRNSESTSSND